MYISEELKTRVIVELQRCVDIINHKYNQSFVVPRVTYDVRGTRAGYVKGKQWLIHLNPDFFVNDAEEMINETGPHEFAHLVDTILNPETKEQVSQTRSGNYRRKKRSLHGPTWKSIMHAMGKSPERCHTMDVSNVRTKRVRWYTYKCAVCGQTGEIGPKIHKQILNGRVVSFKKCGGRHPLYPSMYVPDANIQRIIAVSSNPTPSNYQFNIPLHKMPPAARSIANPTKTKQQQATDLLRQFPDMDRSDTVKLIMKNLKMTHAGASTYYYNAKKIIEQINAANNLELYSHP